MDRQSKIDYLKRLFANKLAPEDLLRLLPTQTEIWLENSENGKYDSLIDGKNYSLSADELKLFKNPYPGPVHRIVIVSRKKNDTGPSLVHGWDNDTEDNITLD